MEILTQLPLAAKPEDDPVDTGVRIGDAIAKAVYGPPADPAVGLFERLAKDPSVDVEKLERLIAMQEHIMAVNRKAAFDAGFAKMQPEIPTITEKGRIEVKGSLRSTYAPLEDIHQVIKPILARHGFAIRHRTEWPTDKPGVIRIVGILSHEQGHSEETTFEAKADASDFRSDIQSQGSTVSYGRRYTTLDLLNISTRRMDDDGRTAGSSEPPDGYEAFVTVLEGIASEGMPSLTKAFNDNKRADLRNYLTMHDRQRWEAMKTAATKATVAS